MATKIARPVNYPVVDPRLNYSNGNSRLDTPRCVVILKGFAFVPVSIEITNNAHGVLDTASVTLTISGNPDFSKLFTVDAQDDDLSGPIDLIEGSVVGEIYIGFPAHPTNDTKEYKQLDRRFLGTLDTVEPNFKADEVVITMRSIGVLLELVRHTNVSLNETTIAFAEAAAKSVGLKFYTDVSKPGTLAQVYAQQQMVGFHNERAWRTICEAADFDEAEAYVYDATLYYVYADRPRDQTVTFRWGHDLLDFSGRHSLQFNKNVKVDVRTHNRQVRRSHTVRTARNPDGSFKQSSSSGVTTKEPLFGVNGSISRSQTLNEKTGVVSSSVTTSTTDPGGGVYNSGSTTIPRDSSAERYLINRPGISPEAANQLSLKIARQISRNEFSATFEVAPTAEKFRNLRIDSWIDIYDLPYERWNSNAKFPHYWPRRMTTRMSMNDGLTVSIEAVNHALPQSAGGG